MELIFLIPGKIIFYSNGDIAQFSPKITPNQLVLYHVCCRKGQISQKTLVQNQANKFYNVTQFTYF